MTDTTPTTAPDLTKEQCEERRQRALHLIESELRATLDSWHQTPPRLDWAAAIALDALGDLAAEILVDGTMMRSLTIRDGVATLELAEATELVRVFAAGMRGVLNGHGASNYVEMELTDGATGEGFTVTVQRRECPTPHQFRQRAEARVAELEAEVARLVLGTTDQQPATAPAATCSAEYHGDDDGARLCIRAAQHTKRAHTDEHGFHWSDTVAVYPVADGTFRTGVNLRAACRRMADEAQQPETEAHPTQTEWIGEVLEDDGLWMYLGSDPDRSITERRRASVTRRFPGVQTRAVRKTTTYTVAADEQPKTEGPNR